MVLSPTDCTSQASIPEEIEESSLIYFQVFTCTPPDGHGVSVSCWMDDGALLLDLDYGTYVYSPSLVTLALMYKIWNSLTVRWR